MHSALRDLRGGSWNIRKINIRRHAGAQPIVIIRQTNLYAKDLFDAVFDSLHVARSEFGLAIDLFNLAGKIRSGKRIDLHSSRFTEFDFSEPGFRNVNPHPKMLRQKQGSDFAIRRQHVADLHAKHFKDRFGRRDHLHFLELRLDIRQLSARLNHFHLSGFDILLLSFGCAVGPFGVVRRNDSAREQILLAFGIGAQKLQLSRGGVGVSKGSIDLCCGQIPARTQFSRLELGDDLSLFHPVAFLREYFFHPAGHTRTHMGLVDFDRSRNGVLPAIASAEQERQSEQYHLADPGLSSWQTHRGEQL